MSGKMQWTSIESQEKKNCGPGSTPQFPPNLYCGFHQTLRERTNTKERNIARWEQWWWKAHKCIWQGVNVELKDKQGECRLLFMPMGRQGNVMARKKTRPLMSGPLIMQAPSQVTPRHYVCVVSLLNSVSNWKKVQHYLTLSVFLFPPKHGDLFMIGPWSTHFYSCGVAYCLLLCIQWVYYPHRSMLGMQGWSTLISAVSFQHLCNEAQ